VVDVSGRVRRAGLVRLAAGSRVWDAVVAAGGPAASARLDRLNLARRLTDGEQVFVPGPNDPVPLQLPVAAGAGAPGASAADPGVPAAPVDLNTATAQQLDSLPGVGPVLAQRILAWRAQHGRFSRAEELGEVPGIGDKLFAQLRPRVQV
jgi:competence protein ComEA